LVAGQLLADSTGIFPFQEPDDEEAGHQVQQQGLGGGELKQQLQQQYRQQQQQPLLWNYLPRTIVLAVSKG
jgi:hypothetical protein